MKFHEHTLGSPKTLVMAGGYGSRLWEITKDQYPKHLIPINYTHTLLDYCLTTLRSMPRNDVTLVTSSHTTSKIKKYLNDHWTRHSDIKLFSDTIPDQGVLNCLNQSIVDLKINTPIIKTEGDEVNIGFNLDDMYQTHIVNHHPITLLATKGTPYKYRLKSDPNTNLVTRIQTFHFTESLNDEWWNITGTYIINPEAFHLIRQHRVTKNFLEACINEKLLYIYPFFGTTLNINSSEDVQEAIRLCNR